MSKNPKYASEWDIDISVDAYCIREVKASKDEVDHHNLWCGYTDINERSASLFGESP